MNLDPESVMQRLSEVTKKLLEEKLTKSVKCECYVSVVGNLHCTQCQARDALFWYDVYLKRLERNKRNVTSSS